MSSYELTRVVKRYDGRTVLQIDHLEVGAGRTLAILGPSGAGKSTLLRLLNFLEAADEGEICFDGQPMVTMPPPLAVRRRITTVFQRPLLLNSTVWNNVAYGLWLRGHPQRRRIREALARVGVAHLAKVRAPTLSGGEAQRVALARALVLEPCVLLLDEPTANLDPTNVSIIEGILQDLRERRSTIVIVTHNL
ncbi:MAG: ATP-binding cassette domain-containing protein, partial [Chloroflexota bacterium]|nr:ATP-binding cassette domain-containing protein [Chloroflexota bacterium]